MEETNATIKCSNCGTNNRADSVFCEECGKKLNSDGSTVSESFQIAKYGEVTLTKDYVNQYLGQIGKQHSTHIFLKDVSCVEVGFKSKPWLMILGILLLLAWGAGIILIILYFILRKNSLIITSSGGAKITQDIYMGSEKSVDNFVSKLVVAKKNAMNE